MAKNSTDNGYTFKIEGCHALVRQTPILTYYITARPLHTGQPAFCSDQSGILRTDYGGAVEKRQSNGALVIGVTSPYHSLTNSATGVIEENLTP